MRVEVDETGDPAAEAAAFDPRGRSATSPCGPAPRLAGDKRRRGSARPWGPTPITELGRGQAGGASRVEIAEITGDGPPTERAGAGMAVIGFLPMLIERSVGVLGADAASLVLADGRGDLRVTASSDERAHALELFEAMTREGPGLDCYRGGEPVVNQALNGAGGRWPGIRRHAQAAGFVSSHAFPLRSGEHVIGTLNLFSIGNTTLGEREVAAGQAIADVATIGLVQTRALEQAWAFTGQLQGALNSRVVIEQAKGILAERATVDVDTAFGLLRTYARNHNAPLSEVARGVIEAALSAETITTPFRRGGTQQLPGRPPPPAA